MNLRDVSILFVDDNMDLRQSFDFFMRDSIKNLYLAKDGVEGLDIFYEYRPDIVIADVNMPVLNGIEMSRIIKQGDPDTPIMLISAKEDTNVLKEAIEIKIDTFITKPIVDTALILQKLETFAEKIKNNQNIQNTNEKLLKMATTDQLTGLCNRYKINEILSNEKNRNSRFGTHFSIILIDIDDFKMINDTYGHIVGDQVLVEFAKIISNGSRVTDIAGRWGGEEFIVILPQTGKTDAAVLAKHLKEKINSYSFSKVGRQSASFGVAECRSSEDIKDIIKKADNALYKAKKLGKNRVCIS
jgi:diguanylate cyclase (GGDEF)-like protein